MARRRHARRVDGTDPGLIYGAPSGRFVLPTHIRRAGDEDVKLTAMRLRGNDKVSAIPNPFSHQ